MMMMERGGSSGEGRPGGLLDKNAQWIWDAGAGLNRYVWLRRAFSLEAAPAAASVSLAVDGRYACWVNGHYVGQGPVPYRPPWHPVDHYDVTRFLRRGKNVVAVLGHSYGCATHTSSTAAAGVLGEIRMRPAAGDAWRIVTDASWKAQAAASWLPHQRRRSWATGFAEDFDAALEDPAWTQAEFDDAAWPVAVSRPARGVRLFPRPVPLLDEAFLSASVLQAAGLVSGDIDPPAGQTPTLRMDNEPMKAASPALLRAIRDALAAGRPFTIPADPSAGLALTFDLGREWSGQIELELEAPAGAWIEGAGAERLVDGRARASFKGADYAFRYRTREGRQAWRQFTYNGQRYLQIVFRHRPRPVTVHRLGIWRRHAALDYRGSFTCSDSLWNQLFAISEHTLRISTQEVQVDCPTREQAPYFGDAVWTGLWTAWLTGNVSHLRHLLFLGRTCQRPDGLLPGNPLTGYGPVHVLYDYNLIYVWGVAVLYDYTGDAAEARANLPAIERVLRWFLKRLDADGLVPLDGEASLKRQDGILFIDHHGLGWHIQAEPAIDRRSPNAALQLFLVIALESYLRICRVTRTSPRLRVDSGLIRRLRGAIRRRFWDPHARLFADARHAGGLSDSISEHTNALAVFAGIVPPARGREIIRRVLALADRPVARCSPYFMIYLAKAMMRTGLRRELVELTACRWKPMAAAGATTWWETFLGDHLDSYCHPWSSLPLWLAFTAILGVRPASAWRRVDLQPLRDSFPSATGKIVTPLGDLALSWSRGSRLQVEAPPRLRKRLRFE